MRRIYAVRARGWQLDYRPDGGWLPLGVRRERASRRWPVWSVRPWATGARWWVLDLGRLGVVTAGRAALPTTTRGRQ